MKVLSIIVSCYNSEDYLERCVNSLLLGGSEVEILLVDDGSTDATPAIIDHYARQFPHVVKAIHQENGGPGAAINTGLEAASGLYTKIVDSDDWLDAVAYQKMLSELDTFKQARTPIPDLVVTNYVYDHQGARRTKPMRFSAFLPQEQRFGWEDVTFPPGKYLTMHSMTYRTQLLQEEAQLKLPAHSFYVDSILVFEPLLFVQRIYYLNVNLYHYYIGREDQSVNEDVMLSRIDQQLAINKRLIHFYASEVPDGCPQKPYLEKFIEITTTISSILLVKGGTPYHLTLKQDLWRYARQHDNDLYTNLRRGAFGIGLHLPGRLGRKTAVGIYRIAKRLYGFN